MQIPILSGIYTNEAPDFRTSYPINMVPVPKTQGISNGYLRPAEGIVEFGSTGPGINRGGTHWDGKLYRVMGTKLVHINENGVVFEIGNIAGSDLVTMDRSFDYLSISNGYDLYLYDKYDLHKVTDSDLGDVVDHIWVDGYFMTTDGEYIIVTELNDPFTVLPTKYGSSEADPDPIKALIKLKNEPYALNRYTIEVFDNIGGVGFPFQRISGAQIQRGVVGIQACCIFLESVAFMGGGRNEAIGVWLAAGGSSIKISTREIEQILANYTETTLSKVLVESRSDKGHQFLYIHLPDQTLVYDGIASQALRNPIWFILASGLEVSAYRAKSFVWCYNKWWVADTQTGKMGYLTESTSEHWGETVGWRFDSAIIYNEGNGAIFHELELVCLSGRAELGDDPRVFAQYSVDGESWSTPKYVKAGEKGQRQKRLVWLNQGHMRHWRILRFQGSSDAQLAIARLEASLEPLQV